MGQVSGPEQNSIVTELAGPSQHLLPATSKNRIWQLVAEHFLVMKRGHNSR
jgi:hypothetical protein